MKKKKRKKRNEQPWIETYTLVLQTMSSPLSLFWFEPIGFLSKMMSCKLNHNLIYLGHEPLSKSLGTNLKLLTNKNVRFHWTILVGPLSKVALNVKKTRILLDFTIIMHNLTT